MRGGASRNARVAVAGPSGFGLTGFMTM